MKAFFRVDASPSIGTGHLTRSLALASALRKQGCACVVGTHAPSEATLRAIARAGPSVVILEDPQDAAVARRGAEGAEIVVVDGYTLDAAYHEALRGVGRVVCVLDDTGLPIGGDVVVNGNLYAKDVAYERDGLVRLAGPEFALLREEVVAARAQRLARGADAGAPRLLVTMGGADPTGETEKAIAAVALLDPATPLDVRVLVGGANPRAEAIRALAGAVEGHAVRVDVDVVDMGAAMAWADIALAATGGTCLELACVGVAAIAIQVADNQRFVARALAERGLAAVLGETADVDAPAIAAATRELLSDAEARRRMEAAQRATVDGRGASRVAEQLAALASSR